MSYQVIARKWRPQSFADVVGQVHITQTLGNALKNGRLPHALLFTGPRGTGKTSSARILAKALRCPNAVDFVPCNQCDSCLEITNSSAVDVIEIDGASNNGVDAIRELRDTVGYMPSSGSRKVYIIDEVHMLSTSAFNALLKTLEEPPPHVIFIMATTEVHKIPQTILSRCQRFDFRRISTKQIATHLKKITSEDNIKADEDALWVIARQGDGSMRDSQSLLDQVITFADGDLTRSKVTDILGLTDRSILFDTLSGLVQRDSKAILRVLEKLNVSGVEPALFVQDLLEMMRNLLLAKVSGDEITKILELPESEIQEFVRLGADLPEEDIHLLFDLAMKASTDVIKSQDPRLVLEVVLLRMVSAPKMLDLKKFIELGSLPEQVSQQPDLNTKPAANINASSPGRSLRPHSQSVSKQIVKNYVTGSTSTEKWLAFVDRIRLTDALFTAKVENLMFVAEQGKTLQLAVPVKLAFLREQMTDLEVRKKLQGFIDSHWGEGYSFEVVTSKDNSIGETAHSLTQKKMDQAEEQIRQVIEKNPLVLAAKASLKGQIKSVTPIK